MLKKGEWEPIGGALANRAGSFAFSLGIGISFEFISPRSLVNSLNYVFQLGLRLKAGFVEEGA
jgi:hypothetical protein